MKLTIREALKEASKRLKGVGERPLFEAETLLAYFLDVDRIYLHMYPDKIIDADGFLELIKRRENFEPIEYITKKVSFYSKEFFIDRGALIPRPETEILIDELLKELKGDEKVLEIGVGSGIISTILKLKLPSLNITATDISKDALEVAKKNLKKFNVDVKLVNTSLADKVGLDFDVIVSNPPYIKSGFILEKNVIDFEPKEALFGGEEGDEILKKIISLFKKSRAKLLACEIGFDQKERLKPILKEFNTRFYKDLAGFDRGFIAKKES